ncbi:MAG: hypothetical protein LBH09_00865 [Peptococcaceae bacterium]|jgi:hypothetical protein|nr:hypothetical protein [Peptococcaceae bacterium]
MNYIWEVLLQGESQSLGMEEIHFAPSGVANPYREVFFGNINKVEISGEPIEVNAFYRFSHVFEALLREDMDANPELQETLFDILMHYLAILDLRSGLCRAEYYMQFLIEDVEGGLYGKRNAESLKSFRGKDKRLVAAELVRMYKTGSSMRLFARLLREIYPDSIVYLDTRGVRELLVYVGKKQTEVLTDQIALLCDLFVPADYSVKLFWEHHFGLIDIPETMEIGQIMMY